MDLTDNPDDAYGNEDSPPDFDELESPASLLKGGTIRERLLDVVVGLREPTKVSTVAERASCDTETAREYLQWFEEMGMVTQQSGRPVRYARNNGYFQWRRVDRIRRDHSEQEIVSALADVLEQIEAYRTQFDAAHPDDVSLIDATRDQTLTTEAAWEALSEWETLKRHAAVLDAARQEYPLSGSNPDPADA